MCNNKRTILIAQKSNMVTCNSTHNCKIKSRHFRGFEWNFSTFALQSQATAFVVCGTTVRVGGWRMEPFIYWDIPRMLYKPILLTCASEWHSVSAHTFNLLCYHNVTYTFNDLHGIGKLSYFEHVIDTFAETIGGSPPCGQFIAVSL